jgi:DNA helicase IV
MAFVFNTVSEEEITRSLNGKQMMHAIRYDGDDQLFVTGRPGSGKTTISLLRAVFLHNQPDKKVLLLTFQNLLVTSLRNSVPVDMRLSINTFDSWSGQRKSEMKLDFNASVEQLTELLSAQGERYYEIIIDEAQDLPSNVFQPLFAITDRLTIGADTGQKVHPEGTTAAEIEEIISQTHDIHDVELQYNYRNFFEIYDFARQFVPHMPFANGALLLDSMPKGKGRLPEVIQTADEIKTILNLLEQHTGENIAVLFENIAQVDSFSESLKQHNLRHTKYHSKLDWRDKRTTLANVESIVVTTYKSAKGLEFQTVIMPHAERLRPSVGNFFNPEHCYVGCTRATQNLYLTYRGDKPPYCLLSFRAASYTHQLIPQLTEENDLPF